MRDVEELPPYSAWWARDMTGEALLVFDVPAGSLAYVNAEASALFGFEAASLSSVRAVDLLPALGDLTPRRFTASIRTANGVLDVAVRLEELKAGPFAGVGGIAVSIATRSAGRAQKRSERLDALFELVVRRDLAKPDQICAILRESVRGIGLERATLGRFDGAYFVGLFADAGPVGQEPYPLETAVSEGVFSGGILTVLDTHDVPEFAAVAGATRCLLASPLVVDAERYVLTFASSLPRADEFTSDDYAYVETVVETLSRAVERLTSDARIELLAYSDALTALPNRIALLRRIDDALLESDGLAGRTAILFLDIDGFKSVNDTVGHRGGDIVLADVAQRLRGTVRRQEYIGRLGGDEFAVVMPHVADRHEIESIAQRLGSVLTYPFRVNDVQFSLSASIGVAVYPDDASTRDDLLGCADAAMYAVKAEGGSRVRFYDQAVRSLRARLSPASLEPSALASEPHDNDDVLYYQPILELRSGSIVGAQAMLRKGRSAHGMLASERAWSIAHDDPGRRALDRWILRETAAQARAWHAAGTQLRIDVNVSSLDVREIELLLADEALASDVRRLRIELAPAQVLEGARSGGLAAFAAYCARRGMRFALDSFDGHLGILGSLEHLPIDCVKLDRSLVDTILLHGSGRAVIEGTIIVAKSLRWNVIAKGVENAQQQEALVSLGCDGIQGFYVAPPMTSIEFGEWLGTRRFVGREA